MDTIIHAARLSTLVRQLQRPPRRAAATPLPDSAIGPIAAVEAVTDAGTLIDARAQAELILQAARAEAEEVAAALRLDAEQRGYADGLARGVADGCAPLQQQAVRLSALADALVHAKAAVLADAEDAMVDLAFAALCSILGEQAGSRDGVVRMVSHHSAQRRDREQVTVRLHPDDFALLQADDAALAGGCRADPTIELGGCIVDSSTGSLDARLETQLTRLRETLLTVRAERAHQEAS